MNETIMYYNQNAHEYFERTIDVDFDLLRMKFVSLLHGDARIIDVGCGSGRDVKAFCDMGYNAIGLDASEMMAIEAKEQLGIRVITGKMEEWKAWEPFDGIWCCAALLHLRESEADIFLNNLPRNIKPGGVLFISVKEGIETGYDEKGRFMRNYTEDEIREKLNDINFQIIEIVRSADNFGRDGFSWLNVFARKGR